MAETLAPPVHEAVCDASHLRHDTRQEGDALRLALAEAVGIGEIANIELGSPQPIAHAGCSADGMGGERECGGTRNAGHAGYISPLRPPSSSRVRDGSE
jgi:hypothetical protein